MTQWSLAFLSLLRCLFSNSIPFTFTVSALLTVIQHSIITVGTGATVIIHAHAPLHGNGTTFTATIFSSITVFFFHFQFYSHAIVTCTNCSYLPFCWLKCSQKGCTINLQLLTTWNWTHSAIWLDGGDFQSFIAETLSVPNTNMKYNKTIKILPLGYQTRQQVTATASIIRYPYSCYYQVNHFSSLTIPSIPTITTTFA